MTARDEPLTTRPGPLSSGLIVVTTRLLPAHARDRYYDEFRADLCYLPWTTRTAHAAGLLLGAFSLRRALKEHPMTTTAPTNVYWKCRIGRHHYRTVNDDNPENRRSTHLECMRCLKFKEITEYEKATWIRNGGMMS
jgi:hypothetical protein